MNVPNPFLKLSKAFTACCGTEFHRLITCYLKKDLLLSISQSGPVQWWREVMQLMGADGTLCSLATSVAILTASSIGPMSFHLDSVTWFRLEIEWAEQDRAKRPRKATSYPSYSAACLSKEAGPAMVVVADQDKVPHQSTAMQLTLSPDYSHCVLLGFLRDT